LFEDHFVEILAGEGKLIILDVTATSIIYCDVTCISDSKYLSERNCNQLESMFSDFGISHFVKYLPVYEFCNDIINERGNIIAFTNDEAEINNFDNTRMKVFFTNEVGMIF